MSEKVRHLINKFNAGGKETNIAARDSQFRSVKAKGNIQHLINKFDCSAEEITGTRLPLKETVEKLYDLGLCKNNEENKRQEHSKDQDLCYSSIPCNDTVTVVDDVDNGIRESIEGVDENNDYNYYHTEEETIPSHILTASRRDNDDEQLYSSNIIENSCPVTITTVKNAFTGEVKETQQMQQDNFRNIEEHGSRRISTEEYSITAVEHQEKKDIRVIENSLRKELYYYVGDSRDAGRKISTECALGGSVTFPAKYTIVFEQ